MRKVYYPVDAKCYKCGLPIAFYQLNSDKWAPCNLDGSDHWDDCRANRKHKVNHDPGRCVPARVPLIPVDCDAPPFVADK